ncbi:MAG: ASCH domain-containing protein [Patescibacteria group bacterium]
MKTLKFKAHLVTPILSGEKISTWRLFDDKNLTVGDEFSFVEAGTTKEFARAIITGIREKKLTEATQADFDVWERRDNLEEMLELFRGYYGDRVTPESMMKLVTFRLHQ